MLKFFFTLLLIAFAGFFLQPLTPWWSIALIAFVGVLVFNLSPSRAWTAGFLGGFLLWGIAAFLQYTANDGLLASRIGQMLGGVPGSLVPLLSAFIGGITASLGALSGSLGRRALGLGFRVLGSGFGVRGSGF